MGQAFDLAEGTVLFKGDFTQFDEDLKAGEAKLKTLNNALKDGSFKMQLYAAKSFNDELAKANRQAKKLMDEVKFGKWGALFKDFDFSKAAAKFSSGAAKVGAAAAGVGGGALALGAGGSPLAQNTLSGSFELLKTEVGGIFTPLVKDVSRGLQEMRNTFRGLSEETKSMINEGAKFIGIAGLTALALATLSKGLSLIAKHPLIALLAGGLAAFDWVHNQNIKQQASVEKGQEAIFNTTAKDARDSMMGTRLRLLKPEIAAEEAKDYFRNSWMDYEKKRKEHEAITNSPTLGAMSAITEGMGFQSREKTAREEAIAAGKRLEEAKFLMVDFAKANLKERPKMAGKKDDLLLGAFGPTTMVGGVAEMFKSFQLAAAGGNSLEAEIKKTELKNQEKMLKFSEKQTVLLEKIERNLPVGK